MTMDEYGQLRQLMVKDQLIGREIKDKRVLSAFSRVPRHLFVPTEYQIDAYSDCALPIGEDQTISQPYMVAIMSELLQLKGNEKVLEIGTGSGYQTAILAELCKKVYSIERIASLSKNAENRLKELGYSNITCLIGDGTQGYLDQSPYDGIIVTAAGPTIPQPFIDQLAEGGRLVLPVGEKYLQTLMLVTKQAGKVKITPSINCVFVPLIGKQ